MTPNLLLLEAFALALVTLLVVFVGAFAFFLARAGLRAGLARRNPGQSAFILHRVAGVGVLGFLSLHILDTGSALLGPTVYDRIVEIYKQTWFKPLELGLAASVVVHAVNGLRITAIDFWPRLASRHRELTALAAVVALLLFLPMAWAMLAPIFSRR